MLIINAPDVLIPNLPANHVNYVDNSAGFAAFQAACVAAKLLQDQAAANVLHGVRIPNLFKRGVPLINRNRIFRIKDGGVQMQVCGKMWLCVVEMPFVVVWMRDSFMFRLFVCSTGFGFQYTPPRNWPHRRRWSRRHGDIDLPVPMVRWWMTSRCMCTCCVNASLFSGFGKRGSLIRTLVKLILLRVKYSSFPKKFFKNISQTSQSESKAVQELNRSNMKTLLTIRNEGKCFVDNVEAQRGSFSRGRT